MKATPLFAFPFPTWRYGISLCSICFLAFVIPINRNLSAQSNISQSLSINAAGIAADVSALLDISANNKGVLIPRMSFIERIAIASPATGLLVYDSTSNGFWYYNGVIWVDLSAPKLLVDNDGDTRISVETTPDDDAVRMSTSGSERLVLRQNASGSTLVEFPNNGDDVYLGTGAGLSNTTGDNNTAVGKVAMSDNTTGFDNSALGAFSLNANTTGAQNTGIGAFALSGNQTASENTAVGYLSLASNTSAAQNTAVGALSLRSNTTGGENVAVGYRALFANTTGPQNTACGNLALENNTIGDDNSAFGLNALRNNTSGHDNSAVGQAALFANTTGAENVAVGRSALGANTSGIGNTAIGRFAMNVNTTGSNNTTLGFQSDVSTGNLTNATAIGANALVNASNSLVLGSINGVNGATSSVNVGIGITTPELRLHILGGSDAAPTGGGYIQTGSSTGNNVAIDENEIMARLNGAATLLLLNNNGGDVKIGNNTSLVGIGRTAVTNNLEVEGNASKSSAGDWLANSDARLKKNISPLNSQEMLQKLLSLQGVTYEWNDDKTGSKRPEGIQYGFTAQNIQTVFPTLVEEDKLGYLQTAYGTYDAMTVEAIRALHSQLRELGEEIGSLKMENAALQSKVKYLEENQAEQLQKITAALAAAGITVEK